MNIISALLFEMYSNHIPEMADPLRAITPQGLLTRPELE